MVLRLKNLITRRVGILLLMLLCGFMATACSMTRIGYEMVPTLAKWEIEEFVTFDDQQQAIADQRLESLHEWHRLTQVPVYVGWLDQVIQRLEPLANRKAGEGSGQESTALTIGELAAWRREAFGTIEPVLREMAEPIAQIALTFSPAQLDEIELALTERNKSVREEYRPADAKEAADGRVARWRDRLEFFIGDLSEKQQAWLDHKVRALPLNNGWWEARLRRQKRMMAMLRGLIQQQASMTEAVSQVREYFQDYESPTDSRDLIRRDQLARASDQMLAELLEIGSATQFEHARGVFAGFAADLRSIANMSDANNAGKEVGDLTALRLAKFFKHRTEQIGLR